MQKWISHLVPQVHAQDNWAERYEDPESPVTQKNLCSSPGSPHPSLPLYEKRETIYWATGVWVPVIRSQTQFLTCSGMLQVKWETKCLTEGFKDPPPGAWKASGPCFSKAKHLVRLFSAIPFLQYVSHHSDGRRGREMGPCSLIVLPSYSRPGLPHPDLLLGKKNDPLYFLCILRYRVRST